MATKLAVLVAKLEVSFVLVVLLGWFPDLEMEAAWSRQLRCCPTESAQA